MDSFTSRKTHGGGEVSDLIYVLAGGFGVFYVLPKIASLIANLIHRYIHSASLDAGPSERRHLDAAQNAVAGLNAKPLLAVEAKQRQKEHDGGTPGGKDPLMEFFPPVLVKQGVTPLKQRRRIESSFVGKP